MTPSAHLFAFAFAAAACFACGSPVSTSDSSTGAASFSFDVTPTSTQGDGQCMPNVIVPRSDCSVSCVAYVVYPNETDQAAGCTDPGTSQPDPQTLARVTAQYRRTYQVDPSQPAPVACAYGQLVGGASSSVAQATACTNATPDYAGASCRGAERAGWCYAEGAAITGGCPVGIQFGASGPPAGARLHFDCLEPAP